jgi:hypothetical protein
VTPSIPHIVSKDGGSCMKEHAVLTLLTRNLIQPIQPIVDPVGIAALAVFLASEHARSTLG